MAQVLRCKVARERMNYGLVPNDRPSRAAGGSHH
jgi:hypothetical protein